MDSYKLLVSTTRPSFSSRRRPHLERPAAPRHVRIITACFPKPPEDAPLPAFFYVTFVQCLRSDSSHYWHTNRSFYLLTYLLTYYEQNNSLQIKFCSSVNFFQQVNVSKATVPQTIHEYKEDLWQAEDSRIYFPLRNRRKECWRVTPVANTQTPRHDWSHCNTQACLN